MFEGDYRVVYHLAPPLLARTDPVSGEPKKMRFGAWMLPVFKALRSLKFLRGTALDPFGYTQERRTERALIREYEETVERLLTRLTPQNHAVAVQIAALPEEIRGFGHIKARTLAATRQKRDQLLSDYETGAAPQRAAA
jgi:indolepyruvate ferredoxin oxidoreductase